MNVELVQATPNPVEFIAKIASICYDSDPKDPMKLVKHLYRNGHHSVFEHVYFTFKVEGISRACSHQWVRHRHTSPTQRSQRYCSEDGFGFVVPPSLEGEDEYLHEIEVIRGWYESYQRRGIKNEDARFILPEACETKMFVSFNLRELIHIANERLCSRAQWEIRGLVRKMVELVEPELRWMLVPKCQSGFLLCNNPCKERGAKEE